MKKIILPILLILSNLAISQIDYSEVMDLLIANKRLEARNLFDKQFEKTKDSNIDLIYLDALIDEEMGKVDFDETTIKKLEKLENSQFLISALINNNIILSNISNNDINDLLYKKIDFLSASNRFKDLNIIKYRKAFYLHKRLKFEEASKSYETLHSIQNWQYCGVFENLNGSGLNTEYEPELNPESNKLFNANSNGLVGWYTPKIKKHEPYHFFGNEAMYGKGIIYAQTFITNPNEVKDYILSFGSSNGLKIFLNNKEIYINQEITNTNLDAYSVKISLPKGNNRLLFKIEMDGSADYFSAQLMNIDNSFASNLICSSQYGKYAIDTSEPIESKEISLDFEAYFDDLVIKNPNNVLYKLFQFSAYEANRKKTKALGAIEGLEKLYPKSSLINRFLVKYYTLFDDEDQKIKEIKKSIETNDPDNYSSIIEKLLDEEWVKSASIKDLENYRNKSEITKKGYVGIMCNFMIATRKSDKNEMLKLFDEICKMSYNNEKLLEVYAGLLVNLTDNKTKAISILENIAKNSENFEVNNKLIEFYQNANRKDDVKKILLDRIKNYDNINSLRNSYIEVLVNDNQYEKALALVDENLEYFPYSFNDFKTKAGIYSIMKNDKEAEKYIRKYLVHDSGNTELRKSLYDITNTPDEIEKVETKDIYKIIKDRKGKLLKSDYGVSVLLDEFIVNVFPEGGRKSKITIVYEITSEKGIEELKEYNLSSYGKTILKSEIIKLNGSIIPAERGDDKFVFTDLKVGDVIFIQYEGFENGTGRFYKDFQLSCYFNSNYPCQEAIFGYIYPSDTQFITEFSNGIIPSETTKINDKTCQIWRKINQPALDLNEDYSKSFDDLTNQIKISTIKSWKEISNWYADLVKKSLKTDKITKDTFLEIFPKGVTGISQDEIAKKIYIYIEKNITYSYLDFRQSGFIPQKPSKTINTKLGDCKDVSTLFVALAEMAGLKSNLVLISTNDNSETAMLVPNSNFNHCIVKVILNNKDYFLELTDKYLPYKALPNSLYNANGLVISFDKIENDKSKLIKIPFDNAMKNLVNIITELKIDDKSKNYKSTITFEGASKAYYNELFSEATTSEVRNKKIEEELNTVLKKVVVLKETKILKNDFFEKDITFQTNFNVSERLQTVGSLKITDVPFLTNVYTRNIITLENRKYDIIYNKYENVKEYKSEIFLNIDADKKFTEIPKNQNFNFLGHTYKITYVLLKPNQLKVNRLVTLSLENIKTTDYLNFKKYIEEVIATEEQVIGFK